jgi:DnaD/phage-associated family protein
MPERGFNTEFWADTFIEALPPEGKLLYIYLWTNPHCNQAGIYNISLGRIAYETHLPIDTLPALMKSLETKIKWYQDDELVWVKNFIKHQYKSPKFLIGAANRLKSINNNGVVKELLEYNLKRYSISIPYTYSIDTVAVLDSDTTTSAISNSGSNKGGGEETLPEKIDKELAAISQIYEANIGVLTPIVAEKLKEIAGKYPYDWFRDAVAEAVTANVRKLSYIEKILDRWSVEGKGAPKARDRPVGRKLPKKTDLRSWKDGRSDKQTS